MRGSKGRMCKDCSTIRGCVQNAAFRFRKCSLLLTGTVEHVLTTQTFAARYVWEMV